MQDVKEPIALRVGPGPGVSITGLTDSRIINCFFGAEAEEYDYTVTWDDFDTYDIETPGHRCGVVVSAELAAKWDAGIKLCTQAGLHTRSREGLLLRWQSFHPEAADIPNELAQVAAEHEEKIRLERAGKQAEQAQRNMLDSITAGLYSIPLSRSHIEVNKVMADDYRARGVSDEARPKLDGLDLLAEDDRRQHRFCYYRLPSGDVLHTCPGISTTLYTDDQALVEKFARTAVEICGTEDNFWGRFARRAHDSAEAWIRSHE